MAHHHHHGTGNIAVAFFLNLVFTIIEVVGGLLTNSLAILSDALHDLGDTFSLGLAWYFQKLSGKERDRKFTYGYRRFSMLGAIINSIVLIVGSIFIVKEALPRIWEPQEANATGMIFLAILGVVVNGAAVLRLRRGKSHNEKVVGLHMLEDVLGWVAVLIGSVVIHFTGWYEIDPLLSLFIGVFILYNVFKNLRSTLNIILQGIPENVEMKSVERTLRRFPEVIAFHDLHIWSLDGERNMLTIHLIVDEDLDHREAEILKAKIKTALAEENINHCTLEFEYGEDACGEDCIILEGDHRH